MGRNKEKIDDVLILFSPRAEKHIREILAYHIDYPRKVTSFIRRMDETIRILEIFPKAGNIEPYLSHLPFEYRSLVIERNYKMVYRIVDDSILRIVAVWDCRKDPANMVVDVD